MAKLTLSHSVAEYLYKPPEGGGGDGAALSLSHSLYEFLYIPATIPDVPGMQLSHSLYELLYRVQRVTPANLRLSHSVYEMLYKAPVVPPPPPGDALFSCGLASSWVPGATQQEARCEENG